MTRKDYVKIAEAINETVRQNDTDAHCTSEDNDYVNGKRDATHTIMVGIADMLAADNPRFDRERFYRACEGK